MRGAAASLTLALAVLACGREEGSPAPTLAPAPTPAPALAPTLSPGPEGPPDIVLLVLDTLRADHLSCYGYERETSPNLDRLCAASTVYETVHAASSWTLPSHASLFTGLYPIRHGAHNENRELAPEHETLAEALGAAGYATEAIVANAMLSKERRLDRGFDHYNETWLKAYDAHPKLFPDWEFDRALPWEGVEDPLFIAGMRRLRPGVDENAYFQFRQTLAERDAQPLFLFVNLIGIHSPYNSAGPYYDRFLRHPGLTLEENRWPEHYAGRKHFDDAQLEHFVDLYDAEILHADHVVQRMIEDLQEAGRWENTLFIVTSDHGEHFGEHGHLSHVFSLHEGVTRVPLIVHYPPRFPAGLRVRTPVHAVDLFPTILAAAGLPERAVDGELLPRSDGDSRGRKLVSEYYFPGEDLEFLDKLFAGDVPEIERFQRRLRSMSDGSMKLIWASDGEHELYDLAADPRETQNLIDDPDRSEQKRALMAELEAFVEAGGGPRPLPSRDGRESDEDKKLDPETVRQLKELGYL